MGKSFLVSLSYSIETGILKADMSGEFEKGIDDEEYLKEVEGIISIPSNLSIFEYATLVIPKERELDKKIIKFGLFREGDVMIYKKKS